MTLVGIIANPASGKDIRRLVAQATVVDNQAKVNIIHRVLLGLEAMGVARALIMPDIGHLGRLAMARYKVSGTRITPGAEHLSVGYDASARHLSMQVDLLDMPWTGDTADSVRAAQLLRDLGAACIITLGGDGTVRAVSKGAGEVPILPISTGTNNIVPTMIDGTVAGLAAGALATGLVVRDMVASRHKWLQVMPEDGDEDRALVDVAVVRGRFTAARALWTVEDLRRIIVTRADPSTVGISALAGAVYPLAPSEPKGLALTLADASDAHSGRRVRGLLGPGLIAEARIQDLRLLNIGETLTIAVDPVGTDGVVSEGRADNALVLALDGEREIALRSGQRALIRLRDDGPWLVDARAAMLYLARRGLLRQQG
jgi:predicted polyphosphate/ATP-dependent NAD kinase